MRRKTLAVLVGIIGTITACGMLVLLLVMGSVFADARTENIAGPGVDVFLRTPFPVEGGHVVLEVEARGGDRAGLRSIIVGDGDRHLVDMSGDGATWGYSIQSNRDRGSDSKLVEFDVPSTYKAGDVMHLAINTRYVVAMSSGGTFENVDKIGDVSLDVKIYTPGGRHVAQLLRVGLAFACFLVWFLLVWGVAKLYANAEGEGGGEMEGIGLLMGFMGGGIAGYWLFAWRILNALEIRSWALNVVLVGFWCVAPLWFVWKWWKRRKAASRLPAARVVG
jgi:hypothetical protein